MASHGVPRQSQTVPKTDKERQKEVREIEEYKDLVDQVSRRIDAKELDHESLHLTSKLLTRNPEYYTIWNHRRRILTHLFVTAHPDLNAVEIISSDLEFLFPLLLKFPKCYWIWNHRLWLLQQSSVHLPEQEAQKFWQQELNLVAKMLSRDSRNYHGWDYRRTVIAALRKFVAAPEHEPESIPPPRESLTEQEFAYTTKMVRGNLSNFSAWHNRSKLIPRLLAEREADAASRRKMFIQELTLIDDALSMDPNDQSLWFYHQFLMHTLRPTTASSSGESCFGAMSKDDRLRFLSEQIELFLEVLDDWDDCKLTYQNLLGMAESYLAIGGDMADAPVSKEAMQSWLTQLQKLDPLRAGRWTDLEKRLGL